MRVVVIIGLFITSMVAAASRANAPALVLDLHTPYGDHEALSFMVEDWDGYPVYWVGVPHGEGEWLYVAGIDELETYVGFDHWLSLTGYRFASQKTWLELREFFLGNPQDVIDPPVAIAHLTVEDGGADWSVGGTADPGYGVSVPEGNVAMAGALVFGSLAILASRRS